MLVRLPTPTWKEGSSYMFVQPFVHLERDTQSGKAEDWNLAMHITLPHLRKYGNNMKESTLQQILINSPPRRILVLSSKEKNVPF
jgi:hypothetical protein